MIFNFLGKRKKRQQLSDLFNGHLLKKKDVFNILIDLWPRLRSTSVYLSSDMYMMPTKEEVRQLLTDSHIEKFKYIDDMFQCSQYALLLHAYEIEERYKEFINNQVSIAYPRAFGQIWYEDPQRGTHAKNLCIVRNKGVQFIEPQSDEISEAPTGISVYFVRM